MLKGRLGLESAQIPYRDRHGLMWLSRGNLWVQDGTLRFTGAPGGEPGPGEYEIPVQLVTCFILGPGTTVSHDALRICARMGAGLVFAGEDGVRLYASMPPSPDRSNIARSQARHWFDVHGARVRVVRQMYAWRMGEVLPGNDINALRGLEGARAKEMYKLLADRHGVRWSGRRYDRADPTATDDVNVAINHASVAVVATAQVAVAAVGALPQLGFIHEDSGMSFSLDIADLYRDRVTLSGAFAAVAEHQRRGGELERLVRQRVGQLLRRESVVVEMIDRIKELFQEGP